MTCACAVSHHRPLLSMCTLCRQLHHREAAIQYPRTACSSCLFLPRCSGPHWPQDSVHAKCTFLNFAVLCLGLFNKKGKNHVFPSVVPVKWQLSRRCCAIEWVESLSSPPEGQT